MALPLSPITNLNGSAIGVINNNSDKLIEEFGKTFYKDGSVNMDGPIDMDSNRIINLPRAVSDSSPVTLAQLREEKKGDPGLPGLPGVGGNTFLSLASLKTLNPTTYASAILADGINPPTSYAYVTGNYTGKADDKTVVKIDNIPLSVGALVAQQASNIATKIPATAAILRFTQDKLGDNVSAKDFGAFGNNVNDDTTAIRNSFDYIGSLAGGTLQFPKADGYKVSQPITVPSRIKIVGAGSHVGSLITGTHAGNIFECADLDYTIFDSVAFSGSGCTAIAQTGVPTVDYMANLQVRGCHFYGQLARGIVGNGIHVRIDQNTFGYFGTVGSSFEHIRLKGTSGNLVNQNRIRDNRFFKAKGVASVFLDTGTEDILEGNTWEKNEALPVSLNGMPLTKVRDNFFEDNTGCTEEIQLNAGSFLIDLNPTIISGNLFAPNAAILQFVKVTTANIKWAFDYNAGSGTGKQMTNDASGLISTFGNNFTGLVIPNRIQQERGSWNVTDASGQSLAVSGVGNWERSGRHIDVEMGFTFPTNTNNGNAKLGGLPYVSTAVSPGNIVSNISGGAAIASDVGTNTASIFVPGTLTPMTNAQLSGKTIYLSIRYPTA